MDFFSRITRDISDGIIVLDLHGEIMLVNKCASEILKSDDIVYGAKYSAVMMNDQNRENDRFHQFLLDAVYDKTKTHKGDLEYTCPDGTVKTLHVSTSFLFGEDGTEHEGVVIQFTDITEVSLLRRKVADSARVFVLLLGGVCLWVLTSVVWEALGKPVSETVMTKVVEVFGLGMFVYLLKYTSITLDDMGLRADKRTVVRSIAVDSAFTAAAFAALIAIKAVLIKTGAYPAGTPIFRFENLLDFSYYIYPITVVVQEFLTRGVIEESIRRIIPGKYSTATSIIVSSLFFAALHIHKGIVFMLGAALLLGLFGVLYKKQRNIWGLCIPHFVLGCAVGILF